mmetsp:Transcript_89980/g.142196  ORF Transcript_89980/g.142196 Transcript_89980/m.142196 type:complete len:136 (+) Transcript_89980:103-510(+)
MLPRWETTKTVDANPLENLASLSSQQRLSRPIMKITEYMSAVLYNLTWQLLKSDITHEQTGWLEILLHANTCRSLTSYAINTAETGRVPDVSGRLPSTETGSTFELESARLSFTLHLFPNHDSQLLFMICAAWMG